jgi:geranylgeranyl reductase
MEKYDVIIVGAGPGGLKCAEILAKSKKKVLILEKNIKIGSKICAGGVSLKAMKYGVPKELFEKTFNKFKYYNNDKFITVRSEKYFVATLDRVKLGQWQEKITKNAGAELRTSTNVTKIGSDYVMVNNKRIGFKNLVGADGAGSIVRRYLGLEFKKMHLTMQYTIKQEFDDLEIHFDSSICREGYKWIFPHCGRAFIGVGFDPKKNDIGKVKKEFDKWLKEKGIKVKEAIFESMPILYDYCGHKFGNIFLVGEAAGLTYGLTGEGIYPALASGEEIAKLIINKNFKPELIPKILRKKKMQEMVVSILTKNKRLGFLLHNLGFWLMKKKKWQDRGIRLTLS